MGDRHHLPAPITSPVGDFAEVGILIESNVIDTADKVASHR
jgi:hypothetical protein